MAHSRLSELEDALLVHVLSFATAREVEAMAMASRLVALHVLPQYPVVWRTLFARRWRALNFRLDGVEEGATGLQIDARLRALFPASCTESRMYQLLSRVIVPVPSGVDIGQTMRFRGYSDEHHRITALEQSTKTEGPNTDAAVRFAFHGTRFGKDRSVRANTAFPTSFYVAVFKRPVLQGADAPKQPTFMYQIGVTGSGYFEISISKPVNPPSDLRTSNGRVEMTAIGLVTSTFQLVGKQPGWTKPSFGYHGDNGKLYSAFPWKPLGPRFGVDDTVGCGVRRSIRGTRSRVFFTNNGECVTGAHLPGGGRYVPCESNQEWFPAVGLDSPNTIRINFGQEPFACDHAIDELFSECTGRGAPMALQLIHSAKKDRSRSASSVRRTCIDSFVSHIFQRQRSLT